MGDSSRHPSRSKRQWPMISDSARDPRGSYHSKRGRRDSVGISRREAACDFVDRPGAMRRPNRESYPGIGMDRRTGPYSPPLVRGPPRYRSPGKSPRRHELPDGEFSPRMQPESRHVNPREQGMYGREIFNRPNRDAPPSWNDGRSAGNGEKRWKAVEPSARPYPQIYPPPQDKEGRESSRGHGSHSGKNMHLDINRSMSMSSDVAVLAPRVGGGVHMSGGARDIRNSSGPLDDRVLVRLEPRGACRGNFRVGEGEDVRLEPRTRLTEGSDRRGMDGNGSNKKKTLGFGQPLYKKGRQGGKRVENGMAKTPPPEKEKVKDHKEKDQNEREKDMDIDKEREKDEDLNQKPKEKEKEKEKEQEDEKEKEEESKLRKTKAEEIVSEMEKLDDALRDLERRLKAAQEGKELAEENLKETDKQAEEQANMLPVEPVPSDITMSSSNENDDGESQSNFVMGIEDGKETSRTDADMDASMSEGSGMGSSQHHSETEGQSKGAGAEEAARKLGEASDQELSTTNHPVCAYPSGLFRDSRLDKLVQQNREIVKDSHAQFRRAFPENCGTGSGEGSRFEWDGSRALQLRQTVQVWRKRKERLEKTLVAEYNRHLEAFKLRMEEEDEIDEEFPRKPSRSFRGARSDYEEWKLMQEWWGREELESMVKMPDHIAYPWESGRLWINKNRMVKDAAAELEAAKEKNPWTQEERKLFMDKFIDHPKDFHTISTFLEKRSPADCIEFYYLTRKLAEFAGVRRKQQLKKRREQSGTKRITHDHMQPAYQKPRPISAAQFPRSRARPGPSNQARPSRGRVDSLPSSKPIENDVTWTDKDLIEAFRQHGSNLKAISRQLECNVQTVGNYVLKNRRRLGLDDVLGEVDEELRGSPRLRVRLQHRVKVEKHEKVEIADEGVGGGVEPVKSEVDVNNNDASIDQMPVDQREVEEEGVDGLAQEVKDNVESEQNDRGQQQQTSEPVPLFKLVDEEEGLIASSGFQAFPEGAERSMGPQEDAAQMQQPHPSLRSLLQCQLPINLLGPGQGGLGGYSTGDTNALAAHLLDSHLLSGLCGLGGLGSLAMPNWLSTAEICNLLAQSIQQPPSRSRQVQNNGPSQQVVSGGEPGNGSGWMGTDYAGGGNVPVPGLHPPPSVQGQGLRPSLLGSNPGLPQSDLLLQNQADHMRMLGTQQLAQNPQDSIGAQNGLGNRSDEQTNLQREGNLHADTGALSLLINMLRTLPVGNPAMNVHDGAISPLLTAAALQILSRWGSPSLHPNTASTSIPHADPVNQSPSPPPLFVPRPAPQSSSTSPPPGAVLDRFRFQAQNPAAAPRPNPPASQDMLRHVYDPHLLQLLVGSLGLNNPPPAPRNVDMGSTMGREGGNAAGGMWQQIPQQPVNVLQSRGAQIGQRQGEGPGQSRTMWPGDGHAAFYGNSGLRGDLQNGETSNFSSGLPSMPDT